MKPLICRATLCAVALLVASALVADDERLTKKNKKPKKTHTPAVLMLLHGVDLSAEQQAKVDELKAQYATKITDAQKKVADVYTAEQKIARQAALKEANASGKKGKDLKAAADAAVTLTDEQKEKLDPAQSELRSLTKEFRRRIVGLLTTQQRQAVKAKVKKQA